MTKYRLLDRFESTFEGRKYRHRNSQLGNRIADCLFDDLYELDPTSRLARDVRQGRVVLNPKGVSPGVKGRRGDGSLGPIVPGRSSKSRVGSPLPAGPTASVSIGAEVKILAKAMIKQIDRVCSDLCGQPRHFRSRNPHAISVGLVGINQADRYVSYEGDRAFPTGTYGPHPSAEAPEAERRLWDAAEPCFEEFLIVPFSATNEFPFEFGWRNLQKTEDEYGSLLVRLLSRYEHL